MSKSFVGTIALTTAVSISGPAFAQKYCDAKINPPDVEVTAAPAGTPPNVAAFSGVWGPAKWDGLLCHMVIVRKVAADGTAEVFYIHGSYGGWNINQTGSWATTGKITGDTLTFSAPISRSSVRYKMDGTVLKGVWNNQVQATLERNL